MPSASTTHRCIVDSWYTMRRPVPECAGNALPRRLGEPIATSGGPAVPARATPVASVTPAAAGSGWVRATVVALSAVESGLV